MSQAASRVELPITGMTCASCAMRIEKRLNRLDGVQASVNYATEKAQVTAPADFDPQTLVAEVEKAGYTATLPVPPSDHDKTSGHEQPDAELTGLRHRLIAGV